MHYALYALADSVGGVMQIRRLEPSDREWSNALVGAHFGSSRVVSRGRLYDATALPGFIAMHDGVPAGLLQFRIAGSTCEVVVLVVERPREGVGTALLDSMREAARSAGCSRLWLVTTNDNTVAQSFYRALGWRLVTVHKGAVTRSRVLKPEIPEFGANGVAIEDELEYELCVSRV
ncbi:MAG: GNAT family N-acetyltransferase [Gemmatimonadales bacterium]|nr:GNAT family N-acetyltransferase [Gemmatimonadales bacterium]